MYGSRYEVARKLWTCLVLASVGLLSNPLTAQDPPAEKRATDDPYFSSSAAPGKSEPSSAALDVNGGYDESLNHGDSAQRTTKPDGENINATSSSPLMQKTTISAKRSGSTDENELISRYRITERHPSQAAPGQPFEAGHVLAVVGGEPIFVGDLLFDANQLIEKFMPGAPESIRKRERDALVRKLLPKFIDQKLMLVDTVRKLPEGADFEKILQQASKEFDEKALDKIMESMGVDSIIQLDAHLRAQDSSLRQLRRSWSIDQLVRFFVMKDLDTDAEISHRELLDYYRQNISDFQTKGRAKWEQIMVRFERFPNREAAREAIVELGNKVVYGASFAETAKKSSQGYNAENGGMYDWTTQDSLVLKELDAAIFSLPIGRLSDIIETRDGLHIVRVIDRKDASVTSFRDAQVEIREKLQAKKRSEAFDAQLAKLRREIPVEIYDFPAAPAETRVSQAPRTELRR